MEKEKFTITNALMYTECGMAEAYDIIAKRITEIADSDAEPEDILSDLDYLIIDLNRSTKQLRGKWDGKTEIK